MAPTAKLDNNEELRRLKEVNIDEASARRHIRDSLKDIQLNLDHILFKTPENGIKTKESYEVNSREIEIFSKSWLPEASSPRALVCFCHGYGDTCTFFFEDPLDRFDRSRPGKLEGPSMGSYVEKACENHVKKKVEEVLRSKMKAKALMECDQYVSKYAQSATGRTFSVVWTCRKQAKELNTCLHQFTNDNVLEEMRRESICFKKRVGLGHINFSPTNIMSSLCFYFIMDKQILL